MTPFSFIGSGLLYKIDVFLNRELHIILKLRSLKLYEARRSNENHLGHEIL